MRAGVGQPLDAAGVGAGLCCQAVRRVRLPHGAQPASGFLTALVNWRRVYLLDGVPAFCPQRQQQQQQGRQLQWTSCVLNMHGCLRRCGGAGVGMTATGSQTGCSATECRPSMLVPRQIGDHHGRPLEATCPGVALGSHCRPPVVQRLRRGEAIVSYSGPSFTGLTTLGAAQLLPKLDIVSFHVHHQCFRQHCDLSIECQVYCFGTRDISKACGNQTCPCTMFCRALTGR